MIDHKPKDQTFYDRHYQSIKDQERQYRESKYFPVWKQVIEFVRQIPSPRILEIGCGDGLFAHYLYDEGFRHYHGFDFSPEAVAAAKRRTSLPFSTGDATDVNSYGYIYNIAIALEVLEHIQDDFSILDNLREKTEIVFSLPTFNHPGHVRRFITSRSIEKRYYPYVDIKKTVLIQDWFVCWGIVNRYQPAWRNTVFKTRRPVDLGFFIINTKHTLEEGLKKIRRLIEGDR